MLKKMSQMIMSFLVIILAILPNANSQLSQPQFTVKAENGKAFDESCLIGTFTIANGNIADCLEHCLQNCSCQSFQICHNTHCQLCSSNKEDNSSLLYNDNDCVYAMYEMRHLADTFQKMDDQCSGMSCLLKYNCCQQSGLCPKNKICKPIYNITQPWKRFICECPEGSHGVNCEQPIMSCQGHYSNGSRKSGIYKVVDSMNSMYEVYCDFADSYGAWTLVQSYSFANYETNDKFGKALFQNYPVNENAVTWSEYRLSKARMLSIQKRSVLLRFTCDYEKDHGVEKSDYIEIPLRQHSTIAGNEKIIDVVKFRQTLNFFVSARHGKIKGIQLEHCKTLLYQSYSITLHISINVINADCKLVLPRKCSWSRLNYFGKYWNNCLDEEHHCVKNPSSTTQLWFGN